MHSLRPFPLALGLAMATALAGCVGTGQYRAAPVQVPVRYAGGEPATDAPTQALQSYAALAVRDMQADAWWRGFGDARLDRLVDQALAANSDLAAAGLALRKARLEAGLAEADLWPSASGSASGSGSRATDRHDHVDRSYSASAALSWEIDLWGKLRAQRDVARWEADATAEDRENTALALIGEVCSDYWQLAYLNQSIAAGELNLQRLDRTVHLVQVQYDTGHVARLELREAQQNLESQRTAQSQLVQQRVEIRNALTVLLDGRPWPQDDEPQDLEAAGLPAVEGGLPAGLLARRPDLRAAELRLRESLAQVRATARSYYPALSLTGSVGSSSTALSDLLKNPVATLGAGLSLPFLDIAQARLDTRIAGTSYQIAATQFRTTLYTALGEVDNALSARTQLQVQVASARTSYQAAREIERMYEVRYRTGNADLRTWLDAQQTLREAELSLAQVRMNQLDNAVTLLQALGGSAAAAPVPAG